MIIGLTKTKTKNKKEQAPPKNWIVSFSKNPTFPKTPKDLELVCSWDCGEKYCLVRKCFFFTPIIFAANCCLIGCFSFVEICVFCDLFHLSTARKLH